jgi:hypothetical protein
MPTPGMGGEEGFSLTRRIGRALGIGRKGRLRDAVRDFRKPRPKARGRRGDLRRGVNEVSRLGR